MSKRMLAAFVSLAGIFVALYLTMYRLGYIGTLVCAVGSCEKVQTSKWATFLGVPVGAWGVAFYVAVFAVSIAGLAPALSDDVRITKLLVAMTGVGVVFSAWLTYLELFVIDAICQWCVISAVLTLVLLVLSWLDWRELQVLHDERVMEVGEALRGGGYGSDIRNTSEVSLRAVKPAE